MSSSVVASKVVRKSQRASQGGSSIPHVSEDENSRALFHQNAPALPPNFLEPVGGRYPGHSELVRRGGPQWDQQQLPPSAALVSSTTTLLPDSPQTRGSSRYSTSRAKHNNNNNVSVSRSQGDLGPSSPSRCASSMSNGRAYALYNQYPSAAIPCLSNNTGQAPFPPPLMSQGLRQSLIKHPHHLYDGRVTPNYQLQFQALEERPLSPLAHFDAGRTVGHNLKRLPSPPPGRDFSTSILLGGNHPDNPFRHLNKEYLLSKNATVQEQKRQTAKKLQDLADYEAAFKRDQSLKRKAEQELLLITQQQGGLAATTTTTAEQNADSFPPEYDERIPSATLQQLLPSRAATSQGPSQNRPATKTPIGMLVERSMTPNSVVEFLRKGKGHQASGLSKSAQQSLESRKKPPKQEGFDFDLNINGEYDADIVSVSGPESRSSGIRTVTSQQRNVTPPSPTTPQQQGNRHQAHNLLNEAYTLQELSKFDQQRMMGMKRVIGIARGEPSDAQEDTLDDEKLEADESQLLTAAERGLAGGGTLPHVPFAPPKILAMMFRFSNVRNFPVTQILRTVGYPELHEQYSIISKKGVLTRQQFLSVVEKYLTPIAITNYVLEHRDTFSPQKANHAASAPSDKTMQLNRTSDVFTPPTSAPSSQGKPPSPVSPLDPSAIQSASTFGENRSKPPAGSRARQTPTLQRTRSEMKHPFELHPQLLASYKTQIFADAPKILNCFDKTALGDVDLNIFLIGLQNLLQCATAGDTMRYCFTLMDAGNKIPRYMTRLEIQTLVDGAAEAERAEALYIRQQRRRHLKGQGAPSAEEEKLDEEPASSASYDVEFRAMTKAIREILSETHRFDYMGRIPLPEFLKVLNEKICVEEGMGNWNASEFMFGNVWGGTPALATIHRMSSKRMLYASLVPQINPKDPHCIPPD